MAKVRIINLTKLNARGKLSLKFMVKNRLIINEHQKRINIKKKLSLNKQYSFFFTILMTKIEHIVIPIKFKIADGNNKDKGNNAINNNTIKN